jgi:predicted RNase H-like HicB family nuclease
MSSHRVWKLGAPRLAGTIDAPDRLLVTVERDETGAYIAECPSIPGCVSEGATENEALENIREAMQLCLQVRDEQGLPLTIKVYEIEVAA